MNDKALMDKEEILLLERYQVEFNETPPIAFLNPDTSKMMMENALKSKIPFNEKDLALLPDE